MSYSHCSFMHAHGGMNFFELIYFMCAWRRPCVSSRYSSCRYRRSIVVSVDAYGVSLQCFIRCCVVFFDWPWFACSYAVKQRKTNLLHVRMEETLIYYFWKEKGLSTSCVHRGNPLCFSRYLGWCICVLFTLFVHAFAWRKCWDVDPV